MRPLVDPAQAKSGNADALALLQAWHRNQVEKLDRVANAGPDVELYGRDLDGRAMLLTGDLRVRFQEGVHLALQLLGTFPLTVTEPADQLAEDE